MNSKPFCVDQIFWISDYLALGGVRANTLLDPL